MGTMLQIFARVGEVKTVTTFVLEVSRFPEHKRAVWPRVCFLLLRRRKLRVITVALWRQQVASVHMDSHEAPEQICPAI